MDGDRSTEISGETRLALRCGFRALDQITAALDHLAEESVLRARLRVIQEALALELENAWSGGAAETGVAGLLRALRHEDRRTEAA